MTSEPISLIESLRTFGMLPNARDSTSSMTSQMLRSLSSLSEKVSMALTVLTPPVA